MVKIEELMDLTLKEVLETYCTVYSPECDYNYGIFRKEDVDNIYENYNVEEEYPEAFEPEGLICDELLLEDEVKNYDVLVRIMENLGVNRKVKKNER